MPTKTLAQEAIDEISPLRQAHPRELPGAGDAPRTFKQESTPNQTEYHFMVRTVNRAPNEMGAITGDMLDMAVMDWLQSGYKIFAIHYLGEVKGHAGESWGSSFGFHFIKEK